MALINTLTKPEIKALIYEFTTSEKLRFQLYERIANGRTYEEMGLVKPDSTDIAVNRARSREYVNFRKKYDSFLLFAQKVRG